MAKSRDTLVTLLISFANNATYTELNVPREHLGRSQSDAVGELDIVDVVAFEYWKWAEEEGGTSKINVIQFGCKS